MNENLDHSMLIDIGGLPLAQVPEATELATALDSWWLLPYCEAYGVSKERLIEVVRQLQTLSVSEFANLAHQLVGSPEAMKEIEQAVSEIKIERPTITMVSQPRSLSHKGLLSRLRRVFHKWLLSHIRFLSRNREVTHELSMEQKVSEVLALGTAFLVYLSSLTRVQSQSGVFSMGHTRMELVYSWCKDPSQRNQFRANQLSQVAFELTKDAVLDIVRKYPEICNIEAGEFLKSLTTESGTKEVNFLSSADHIGAVVTALLMARQDLVLKVNESLAETLEKGRVEPSDYDRNAAQILLNMKSKEIGEAGILDGSAVAFDEQMLSGLEGLFNPAMLPESSSLPEPLQRELPKEVYTLIYLKLKRDSADTFDEMAREAIDELKESYSWEGFAKYGAIFSSPQLKLSAERVSEILRYAEKVFAKCGLKERQTKVLKLEIILSLRGEQGKWSEADKAKYLGMKQGNYRQHLYQARLKVNSVRHKSAEVDGYKRLLRAIIEGGTLTKN